MQQTAMRVAMRVGELAKRTGVSVRTLHYYDEIGLLSPAQHTGSGHRLYAAGDIVRLQQIKSLRQLGFSLEEVRECLRNPEFSLLRVIELHIARLEEQIRLERELFDHLQVIAAALRSAEEVSVEMFIQTIKETKRMESYYTPEQLEYLKQRRETVGEERIREVEAEWPRLYEEIRIEMEKGTDPADARAQELARRYMGLVEEFTGGNEGVRQSLQNMYEQEEPTNIHPQMDPKAREYGDYIGKALAASKKTD